MKRNKNESYPEYIERVFPNLSLADKIKMQAMIKEAWFDGLRFERRYNG